MTKQLFTILTNKNNKENDHFEKVFSLKTATKTTLFVREQFSTSKRSTCLLPMGLDTSSSVRTSAWLLSYERFHEHNDYMSVLHAKFDVKTVMNEEIPVNEWQKKIKCQSWQKCCLFYKVLKFWVRLTCVYGTSCTSCTLLKFPHNPAFFTINFRHFLFF